MRGGNASNTGYRLPHLVYPNDGDRTPGDGSVPILSPVIEHLGHRAPVGGSTSEHNKIDGFMFDEYEKHSRALTHQDVDLGVHRNRLCCPEHLRLQTPPGVLEGRGELLRFQLSNPIGGWVNGMHDVKPPTNGNREMDRPGQRGVVGIEIPNGDSDLQRS